MSRLIIAAAAGALTLTVGGCYDADEANYSDNGYNASEAAANGAYDAGNAGGNGYATADASGSWPEGARIIVEEGVTYRIDPGGARIRLGADDSRIEVIDGVRFRIDPGGRRVRIDEQGAVIRVEPGDADATVSVNTD